MTKTLTAVLSVLLLNCLIPLPAAAQTDAEYLSAVNFRFSNPGARARGMGGNLVALADDDATAAFVNPAGFAGFDEMQFTVEAIAEEDRFPAPRVETGLAFSSGGLQPARAPERPTIETDSNFLSFASFLMPVRSNKLGFGFFYARPLDTQTESVGVSIDAAFFPEFDPAFIFFPVTSQVEAKNEVFGVAAGYRLNKKLSVGVAVGLSRLEFAGSSQRGDFLDPTTILNSQSSLVDGEEDLFLTLGGLWKFADGWTLGASWQKQTGYDMTSQSSSSNEVLRSEFTIPTRSALGLAYKRGLWTFGVEADFIQYSDLFAEVLGQTFFGNVTPDPTYGYEIPDAIELHLGVEYILPITAENQIWSLRAGVWRDETHVPYYTGQDPNLRAWAPRLEEDIYHWTLGLGLEAPRYAVGVAADITSDEGTDLLVSLLLRPRGRSKG